MFFRKFSQRLMGNHRFRNREGHRLALEVPASRKEIAMHRRTLMLASVKWLGGAGLILWGGMACGSLWQRSFRTSTTYAVGQFELLTNGVTTAPQVAAVTGLRPDQNITDLDLGQLRQQLLTLPRVREAGVERRLPNHLSIRLEERRPAAWLACPRQNLLPFVGAGLLVDADGVVFPASVMLNEYMSLPVIHCADLAAVTPGRPVESSLVRRALELVSLMRQRAWAQPMVLEQIHITNRFTMVAQMDTDALFTFHPDHLEKQIARLDAILNKVGKSNPKVAGVNLQLERNVPVTFFEAAPALAPRSTGKAAPGPPSRRPPSTSRRGN